MKPEYAIWELGRTHESRALDALAILPAGGRVPFQPLPASLPWILLIGAVHGDEVEGVWLLEHLRTVWAAEYPYQKNGVVIWVQANPDGFAHGQRWNAHNVDLNRNLPTKDWTAQVKNHRYPPGPSAASEPETRAMVRLIEAARPKAILSVHSFSKPQVNANGPSLAWAEVLSQKCGYPVTQDIGYPTPGCLGTYAGAELQIPTITLEIERGISKEKVLQMHVPVLQAAMDYWEHQR